MMKTKLEKCLLEEMRSATMEHLIMNKHILYNDKLKGDAPLLKGSLANNNNGSVEEDRESMLVPWRRNISLLRHHR